MTASGHHAGGLLGDRPIVHNKLRDAAVDPHPSDFCAPVNAGKADPHGPDVKAVEVGSAEWEQAVEALRR